MSGNEAHRQDPSEARTRLVNDIAKEWQLWESYPWNVHLKAEERWRTWKSAKEDLILHPGDPLNRNSSVINLFIVYAQSRGITFL